MGDAWGGYKNGQIPAQPMQKVQGYYLRPDAAEAMRQAIAECAKAGITIRINESYRPLGIPSDKNVRNEFQTSTKCSNQYFQAGRAARGETPSAATPGFSNHGWGTASDLEGGSTPAMRNILAKHGWKFDVSGESWHAHFVGVPAPIPPKPVSTDNWKIVQAYLKQYYGYTLAVDGIPGVETWKATQRWLADKWGYTGAIDGKRGPLTNAALKRAGSNL